MSDVSSDHGRQFPARWPGVAWGPTAAVIVTVAALVGSQIVAGLIVLLVHNGARDGWLMSIAGQFYFVVATDILLLLTIWVFLQSRRAGWAQLGWGRQPVWRDVGAALLAYVTYFGVFFMLTILASTLTQINLGQKQELGFDQLFTSGQKLLALVSLVVLPPIIEETVFRGFLFSGLRKKCNFIVAALVTSVLFASLHLLASSQGPLWIAGLDTFVLSLVLCYLREKTGALWAPMMLHALKNVIAFTILLSSVAVL